MTDSIHALTDVWADGTPENVERISSLAEDIWSAGELRPLSSQELSSLRHHYPDRGTTSSLLDRDPARHGVAAAVAQVSARLVRTASSEGDSSWSERLASWFDRIEIPTELLHQLAGNIGFDHRADPRLDLTATFAPSSRAAHLAQAIALGQSLSLFRSYSIMQMLNDFPLNDEEWRDYYSAHEAFAALSSGVGSDRGLNLALNLLKSRPTRTVRWVCIHAISLGPPELSMHLIDYENPDDVREKGGRVLLYRLARAYRFSGQFEEARDSINLALDRNVPSRVGDVDSTLFAEQFQNERERIIQSMAQSTEAAALRTEAGEIRRMRGEFEQALSLVDSKLGDIDEEVRQTNVRSIELLAFFFTATALVLSGVSLAGIGDLAFAERSYLIIILTLSLIVFFGFVSAVTRFTPASRPRLQRRRRRPIRND